MFVTLCDFHPKLIILGKPTLTGTSLKGLHLGRLHPCLQTSDSAVKSFYKRSSLILKVNATIIFALSNKLFQKILTAAALCFLMYISRCCCFPDWGMGGPKMEQYLLILFRLMKKFVSLNAMNVSCFFFNKINGNRRFVFFPL